MYDLLLKNGTIMDGTGNPAFIGDVAISDGKIAKIGENISESAAQTVDVHQAVIAPGFIDMHSHSDNSFLRDERCQSRIYQGITTEVTGQCGFSVYPCKPEHLDEMLDFSSVGDLAKPYLSESLSDYIKKAQANGKRMATNQAAFIGHGALRAGVMGFANRKATPEELREMQNLLDREMAQGAWGLSLGLGYAPGAFSDQEELNAMGEVIAKYDGLIASHMRDQGPKIMESLNEMYEINRKTGARVHISHLKASGKAQFGWAPEIWKNIEQAQKEGIAVTADAYPYTAAASGITNALPKWTLAGGVAAAAKRLEPGSSEREKIMAELNAKFVTKEDGEAFRIVDTNGRCEEANGKNIYQLSQMWDCSMAEALARLIVKTKGNAPTVYFCMSEADVLYFLRQEITIGSDGSGWSITGEENKGRPHPRFFGTYPRFLRLVREHKLCTMEDAVRRITALPASYIGLADRGLLREGMVADITVFDEKTIYDTPTYDDPFQKCAGIIHVLLDGQFALRDGEQTDLRLGHFLKKR